MKAKPFLLYANIVIATMILFVSCESDSDNTPSVITTAGLTINVFEDISTGEFLGVIKARTNTGILSYELSNQSAENAASIDPVSGTLVVDNETVFDAMINPVITVQVTINNGFITETAEVVIFVDAVN